MPVHALYFLLLQRVFFFNFQRTHNQTLASALGDVSQYGASSPFELLEKNYNPTRCGVTNNVQEIKDAVLRKNNLGKSIGHLQDILPKCLPALGQKNETKSKFLPLNVMAWYEKVYCGVWKLWTWQFLGWNYWRARVKCQLPSSDLSWPSSSCAGRHPSQIPSGISGSSSSAYPHFWPPSLPGTLSASAHPRSPLMGRSFGTAGGSLLSARTRCFNPRRAEWCPWRNESLPDQAGRGSCLQGSAHQERERVGWWCSAPSMFRHWCCCVLAGRMAPSGLSRWSLSTSANFLGNFFLGLNFTLGGMFSMSWV